MAWLLPPWKNLTLRRKVAKYQDLLAKTRKKTKNTLFARAGANTSIECYLQ